MTDLQKAIDIKGEKRTKTSKTPGKLSQVKTTVTSNWENFMVISHNLAKLVTAAALLTVSGYSFWIAYNHSFAVIGAREWVLFSGILIGLLGAGQFLKTLGKK